MATQFGVPFGLTPAQASEAKRDAKDRDGVRIERAVRSRTAPVPWAVCKLIEETIAPKQRAFCFAIVAHLMATTLTLDRSGARQRYRQIGKSALEGLRGGKRSSDLYRVVQAFIDTGIIERGVRGVRGPASGVATEYGLSNLVWDRVLASTSDRRYTTWSNFVNGKPEAPRRAKRGRPNRKPGQAVIEGLNPRDSADVRGRSSKFRLVA